MAYLFNYYDPPSQDPPNFCNFCGKEAPENKMYCSYVADKGKNKGKFCGTLLTEEHKNCGNFDD